MTGRGVRVGLGVVLILLGSVAIFSSVDERILGAWVSTGGKFQILPFALIFAGLWLALGFPTKGAK